MNETDPRTISAAPSDEEAKALLRYNLLKLPEQALLARLGRQINERPSQRATQSDLPVGLVQRVLDTTGGTTGNVLPRVDIEQTLYALFVKQFPYFERIAKGSSNGLSHTWNTETATGALTDAQLSLATELTAVTDDTGTYVQKSCNIAQFAHQRGVSFKEQLAVQASGMTYSPEQQELMLGTTRLRALIQRLLLTGNQSTSGGAGAATELGLFNANAFDGLRMITGGLGGHNSGAVQVDQDLTTGGGPFTIGQAVNKACAKLIDNGAQPSILIMSADAKNRLMNEQEGKQRTETTDLIPGVQVTTVSTVAGDLPIVVVPGGANALGTYNRTSDSVLVQDIYVLDESLLTLRYLGSPDINVFEVPSGVDGKLSRRFIMFGFFGLQVADDGIFQGKVRLPA